MRSGAFVTHGLASNHVPVHADVPMAVDAVMLAGFDDKSSPLDSKPTPFTMHAACAYATPRSHGTRS